MLLLPEDVRHAIGDAAISTQVRFGAALGASFGETHVVRAGGAWRLFTRGSFLDPFREVPLSQATPPRIESQAYRERLVFALGGGREESLEIGVLDRDRALVLARDWLAAPGAQVEAPPVSAPVAKPSTSSFVAAASPDLASSRRRLVDLLAARVADARLARLERRLEARERASASMGRALASEPDYVPSIVPRRGPAPEPAPASTRTAPAPSSRRAARQPDYVPSIVLRRGPPEPRPEPQPQADPPLFRGWHLAMLAIAAVAMAYMLLTRMHLHG